MTSNLLSGYYLEHCWRVLRVPCGKEEFKGQGSIQVLNGSPGFSIPAGFHTEWGHSSTMAAHEVLTQQCGFGSLADHPSLVFKSIHLPLHAIIKEERGGEGRGGEGRGGEGRGGESPLASFSVSPSLIPSLP